MQKNVSFHFHPFQFEKNGHYIEKSEGGIRRRYLCGVSSGLKEDAHKERMSQRCIKGFLDQMNSKDVLLYPDAHGIKDSEDIGILVKGEIIDGNDWYTEYRLHEADDGIGQQKVEKINTLWKQTRGEYPYTKPRQKGFSIEGVITDNDIIKDNLGKSILDYVDLDGVLLVPRPAYHDSIANAVFKALGELPDWRADKTRNIVQETLRDIIEKQADVDGYWDKKYKIEDALQDITKSIMLDKQDMKKDRLEIVFKEYGKAMTDLLLNSQALFKDTVYQSDNKQLITKEKLSHNLVMVSNELTKVMKYLKGRQK